MGFNSGFKGLNEENCFEFDWFKNMKQRSQFRDGGGVRFSFETGKFLADYMTSHSITRKVTAVIAYISRN